MNSESCHVKPKRYWMLAGIVAVTAMFLAVLWLGAAHEEPSAKIVENRAGRESARPAARGETPTATRDPSRDETLSPASFTAAKANQRARTPDGEEQRIGEVYVSDDHRLLANSGSHAEKARRGDSPVKCWKTSDPESKNFNMSLDHASHTEGAVSASISAIQDQPIPGQLFQTVDATPFRGKHVHFEADLRTKLAIRRAGLWVRADDVRGRLIAIQQALLIGPEEAFSGNVDWTTVEVELDIPRQARVVSFGITMGGTGQTWIDNARIDVSDSATIAAGDVIDPIGLTADSSDLSNTPKNLDFELGPGSHCL